MGNTCKPMAVSFQCMTKFTTIKKKNFCSHKKIEKEIKIKSCSSHLQYICSDQKKKTKKTNLILFFTRLLISYDFFRALPNPLVSNFKMYHKFNLSLPSFPSWPSAIASRQLCPLLFSPLTICSPGTVQVIFFKLCSGSSGKEPTC